MSDINQPETKPESKKASSLSDKAATAAAIIGGTVAAAAIIPQDELMKEGLPAFWDSVKGIAGTGWRKANILAEKIHPIAFRWLSTLWSRIVWWTLASIALVVVGIQVKTSNGSNVGHVLVAAGTISFAGLGIVLYVLTDGIASLLYLKLKIVGSIFGKVTSLVGVNLPELLEHKDLEEFRKKVRMIMAAATVLCFSLLFAMFFPAWSTLGWIMCFWAMVCVALCAALYLKLEMGAAVKVVFYGTIALIVGMFVVFLLDRLTGGAIGFGGFQKWLLMINGSELLVAFLVLVPVTLLLVGVFTKDKDTKVSYVFAAKYVGIGCGVLAAFLLYKGTISWKQLSGKETENDAVSKTVDVAHQKYMGALKTWESPSETKPSAPQGTASNGGNYLSAPSTGNAAGASPQASSEPPKAKTQRRARKPLPKEEPKKYSNLTQGMDDLEALGY